MPNAKYPHRFALLLFTLAVLTGCGIFDDYGNSACAQNSSWCANTGGAPPTLTCAAVGKLTYECNVDPPGPNAVDVGIDGHFHLGACGSFYCGDNPKEAAENSGAGDNPDIDCVLAGPGIIPLWTFCVPPDNGPCVEVGSPCDFSGKAACCATEQLAGSAPSALECEPDSASTIGISGHCRVQLGQPCAASNQCFSGENTPDGTSATCLDVCCLDESQGCFDPADFPDFCCAGLLCVKDPIAPGFWCR